MNVSAKADYGLRAILELSLAYGKGTIQSADIAASQNIPESYLVQLLNQLRKSGLIRSVRGPRGGHELARRPEDLTVGEVLAVLDGPLDLLGRGEDRPTSGSDELFRQVWADVESAIDGVLSSVTFSELSTRHQKRQSNITFRI
ncbi:MAG: Rrf2 family transcriptional regulator [Gemmatimonadetes bacterium]|nr:Rrf2 family transcriptional regulator [Gemmatimonadota bacterium]|tara:strand:- start:1059 stop:1490 length:432 start_codon:yes stop_codon:yes gene_type:complete